MSFEYFFARFGCVLLLGAHFSFSVYSCPDLFGFSIFWWHLHCMELCYCHGKDCEIVRLMTKLSESDRNASDDD